jgi:molecular chaperone IbpA
MEDLDMRTNFDFTPFRRSTVGFDRLFDLLEMNPRGEPTDAYPQFDIVRESEDSYRVTLAVAGFSANDIEIVAQSNQLIVKGRHSEPEGERQFLHRGIATRGFERHFQLADFIEVGKASFDNGLLSIELKRVVPEAMKPRRIEIAGAAANDRLEAPARADRDAA